MSLEHLLLLRHPSPVDVMNENRLSQPTLSRSSMFKLSESPRAPGSGLLLFSSLLLSSLELSDTKVYEPQIRARLGTAAHSCEEGVLKLRTAVCVRTTCMAFARPSRRCHAFRVGSNRLFQSPCFARQVVGFRRAPLQIKGLNKTI